MHSAGYPDNGAYVTEGNCSLSSLSRRLELAISDEEDPNAKTNPTMDTTLLKKTANVPFRPCLF